MPLKRSQDREAEGDRWGGGSAIWDFLATRVWVGWLLSQTETWVRRLSGLLCPERRGFWG